MIKERVKSFVLVILVFFALVLAEKILVDEKLWPSGYNFFSIGANFKKSDKSASENIITPERIIVNTGYQSSRFEYLRTSPEFGEIYSASKEILKTAFGLPAKDIYPISSENWYSALTGKSVYLSYPAFYSSQNFAGLLGIKNTEAVFKSFCDVVIDENGAVYIKDGDTFSKIETSSSKIQEIVRSALNAESENQPVINYSFDLNFDKEFGSEKTILSPMIPIYSDPVSAEVILCESPVMKDGEINQKAINQILTAFSVNPDSMWRYTEADGTLVFVENTGILKISPYGVLTFSASDVGIRLSSQDADTYEVASDLAVFVDTVTDSVNHGVDVIISSPLTDADTETFTFDYNVSGIPIKYTDKSGVTVKVKNGFITEYSQILRRFEPCGYTAASPIYIETLDNIISKYQSSMNRINIKKMFPAYIDDLTDGEKALDWYIEIDNVLAE